jgi:hypothetical protein
MVGDIADEQLYEHGIVLDGIRSEQGRRQPVADGAAAVLPIGHTLSEV